MQQMKPKPGPVRMLPEAVANMIAAGEVVERPASVVKELVENALDAGATRIIVSLVAAGRRTIEVSDNGHGMSEQDALLAIERHTTSKIRTAEDLDNIITYGFRGEALASIAAVSRCDLLTRREKDPHGVRVRVEGAVLRDVTQTPAPTGTRITVSHLYFNTPVRAKFLKGITTELSRCIDTVQRFAVVAEGVGFQLFHNEKLLLDVPPNARRRERVALIWGMEFAKELIEINDSRGGMRFYGLAGSPALTRSSRSHQFFFMNGRPVSNHALQFGFEEGYRQLLTVGRYPVGIVIVETPPRSVDVNIHPAKREIRFRDEQVAREAMRGVIRDAMSAFKRPEPSSEPVIEELIHEAPSEAPSTARDNVRAESTATPVEDNPRRDAGPVSTPIPSSTPLAPTAPGVQPALPSVDAGKTPETLPHPGLFPEPVYKSLAGLRDAPLQVFDTYLIIPEGERLLIIDQHALHERMLYDSLLNELKDNDYGAQRLLAPLLVDVPAAYVRALETSLALFARLGIHIEPFGGNTFQVTALCHLYDESRVSDIIHRILDQMSQGDFFNEQQVLDDLLRFAVAACRGAIKAGAPLSPEERAGLLDGFRRLNPPYTCPHGRPIVTELTRMQMEKSFRRRQ